MTIQCPNCDAQIELEEPVELEIGDSLVCIECGDDFQVTGTDPLIVEPFDDDDEDEDMDIVDEFEDEDEDEDEVV